MDFLARIIHQTDHRKGWGQDIAALSNMAEAIALIPGLPRGLSHKRKLDLMQKIIERALHPKVNPWKKPIDRVKDLGHFGYFLEHLNICLGLYHQAGAQDYKELATRVSEHLVQASLSQPNAHARLLPHVKMRWALIKLRLSIRSGSTIKTMGSSS